MIIEETDERQARIEEFQRRHSIKVLTLPFNDVIGYSGNILPNWNGTSWKIWKVWTVPIGLGVGKVVKFGRLPVKLQLSVQYMPVHPRKFSDRSGTCRFRSRLSSKLIKGVLFE